MPERYTVVRISNGVQATHDSVTHHKTLKDAARQFWANRRDSVGLSNIWAVFNGDRDVTIEAMGLDITA